MNTNFKQSALKLALVSVLALGGVTSALANIGGSVAAINVLGASTFATAITVGTVDMGADKTREQLFLEIFKRPAQNIPVSSYLFFVVDGVTQQKVKADLSQGEQNILLEGKPVMAVLSQQGLRPDIVQRLEQKIDAKGWLHRAALEEAGVRLPAEAAASRCPTSSQVGMKFARHRLRDGGA